MFPVRSYPLVSDQVEYAELEVIVRELERVLSTDVPGSVIEMGCYNGTTSLFLARLLAQHASQRELHVYDSFSGLPEKLPQDNSPAGEQFKAGELHASKQTLIRHFKQAGLQLPIIHKGWFEELNDKDLPSQIAFAFLDGDFYSSIKASLQLITPHLAPGSRILIDDYHTEALPGAKRATDEWATRHGKRVRIEQSLAIIEF